MKTKKLPGICCVCGTGIPNIPLWMRDRRLEKQKKPKSICKDCYVSSWMKIKV